MEVLRVATYGECLGSRLFGPLGLTHAATSASNAPAGSLLAMNAADLVTFAHMHLNGGEAADGTRVLRADTPAGHG